MTPIKTTPKDFFRQLGALISLYVAIGALINLAFSLINYYFPDALASYFYSGSIAWPISMLVVLVPIFYVLEWLIVRDIKMVPEKGELLLQKSRIYLTLFLTAGIISGDLIALINTYLSGEISTRFIFKFLVILLILALVFVFYILEKTGKSKGGRMLLAYLGIILVLAAIIAGFVTVGSPTKQRNLRFDGQRVSDLNNIQWKIINHWQTKGVLPEKLEDMNDQLYGDKIPMDPESKKAYVYDVTNKTQFKLCASFSLKSQDNEGRGNYYGGYRYGSYLDTSMGENESWKHEAGNVCFERTIDVDKYPVNKPSSDRIN